MKKAIFGLLILVAIGASAFTSADSKVKRDTVYYVLLGDGSYHLVVGKPSEVRCQDIAPTECVIGYATSQGDTFSAGSIPPGQIYSSPTNGIWLPPLSGQ